MSYADEIFVANCKEILNSGYSDKNENVRPVWSDGTPAYTLKNLELSIAMI